MSEYLIAHVGHTQKHDEHVCWWKPDSRGYTICIDKAGRYSEAEARGICETSECIAVPVDAAVSIARTTPYYRLPDGRLARFYDGGPHRPVDNAARNWSSLKAAALVIGKYAKPTPMTPSKQRSIYLQEQDTP